MRRGGRRLLTRLGVAVVFAALALPAARRAHADEPLVRAQRTLDVDAASIGFTQALRLGDSRVLAGGGFALGPSPILGRAFAAGTHYDPTPHVNLWELVNIHLFFRFEIASWLRADAGIRSGVFIHGGENYEGGQFYELFVAPGLVWRWLWVGPRLAGGLLTENGNNSAGALVIDYLMARAMWSF